MAGTLAFSRFVIKDIFRNKGRTLSSIIGVVLAVSLIAGENIALDTTARDVLAEELKDFKYDLLGASEDILSTEDVRTMEDQLESKFGVKESLAMTHLATRFEIHNSSTIITPTYGYNEKRVDIQVPQNGTLWLNTSLEQIPHKTYKLYGNVYSLHNGKPVEKITVKAYEMQSVTWYEGYSTYINTTESGYYELFLPASEHEIRVELGDSTYHIERVNITSSEPEKHLDFHIYDIESSSIEGYVKDPRTGDPYTGSLYIEIWNHTIPHSNFTSIEKGYYHINTVPGNISVKGLSGSWRGPFTNHSQVAVASNSIVWLNLTVVIDPVEDVLLEGYVYDQMSSAPIYHAWVIVQSLDFDYWYDEWTNDLGYFNLNISHGNVSIYVYESGYMEEEMKLSVLAGETRQLNFFLKHMNSSIKGYVYTADGAPLEGAHIEVLDTYRLGKTNQYGYYDIRITAGDYTITIDAKADDYPIIHEDIWIETYSFLESQRNIDFFGELAPYELKAGVMEIGDGKIVIANHTAEQYDLNVGDEIFLLKRIKIADEETEIITQSFNISGIAVWEVPENPADSPYPDFLLGREDLDFLISSLPDLYDFDIAETVLFIKMDRDKIIDPFSRESTELAMRKLATRINSITAIGYDIIMQSVLEEGLESYFDWFESYRMEMLAYSLPVVAVGFYLGIVGIDLSVGQKRRVYGILKSRGANEKQIYMSLLLEAVILGVIAGICGLVLGVFISRIFLTTIPGSRNITPDLDFFQLNISTTSILMAMIFAVILMLFASIKPAKRVSQMPVIESMHHRSEAAYERAYSPFWDIFFVSFAVFAYIMVAEVNFSELDPARFGVVITILLIFLYIISILWLPFSPIILMFSLTRLLTRGTDKVYRFFSRAVKPFAGELWYVIHKNMTRNPKRVSMVSIIIALALGFGIFMTTMIGTTMYGEELEERAKIGADLYVIPSQRDFLIEDEIEKIDGVSEVIPVTWMSKRVLGGGEYLTRKISFFNASEYLGHVDVDDHYFVSGSPKDALTKLSSGNAIIVGESIAETNSLSVGSRVRVEDISEDGGGDSRDDDPILKTNTFTVVGIVRAMPGLEYIDMGQNYWGGGIYMDFSSLDTSSWDFNSEWHFLVDVEDGKDSKVVENAIFENLGPAIKEIKNLKTAINNIRNDMPSNSILYLMLINIGFMIIIITMGLGLILFISISERKNEFATMMARGAESKHISVLIIGEALSITMVGAIVGVFSGLFTAYTFNKMLTKTTLFGAGQDMMSGRPLIIPWYGVLIIILALIALIITSILAAFRAKRIKLHSALRIRGG